MPLDSGKTYLVSMALRSDVGDAEVTITLCQIRNNHEVVELGSSQIGLDDGLWHVLILPEVETPLSPGRFELIVTASAEGRYFWKDLRLNESISPRRTAKSTGAKNWLHREPFYWVSGRCAPSRSASGNESPHL